MTNANGSDIINVLVTGGLGATIGSIVTALIQVFSKKGESRAKATDIVTCAAERIVIRLERENRSMRKAIVLLTEINDEIIFEMKLLGAEEKTIQKVKRANSAARLALSPDES